MKDALRLKIDRCRFWSDSTITLNWIHSSPHEFKTFEANRIAEIQNLTSAKDWKHVPTKENPADVVSRGQLPEAFLQNRLWREGREWLVQSESRWPGHFPVDIDVPGRKGGIMLLSTSGDQKLDLWNKYSSLTKLQRVMAYCLRIAQNIRGQPYVSGSLTPDELKKALNRMIFLNQHEEFREAILRLSRNEELPKQSKLRRLDPILKEGLLRVGGRIKHADINLE